MGGAVQNLGRTLGIGEPAGTKTGRVMARLSQIPIEQRTSAEVFRIMAEEGVQRPAIMYEDITKNGFLLKESELYKERQKEQKESANQLPLTPELLGLLKEQVPSFAGTLPTQPAEPLGRLQFGAAQIPLTPELLQGLVPDLRAASLPGQPPSELSGLPPAALFGPEAAPLLQGIPQPPDAAQSLPQVPVPGQTVPTVGVSQAFRAATASSAAKLPSVGEVREAVALANYDRRFTDLTPDERKEVNRIVDEQLAKRSERQGTARPIPPAEQTNIVDRRTLSPPKMRPTTYQEFYNDPNLVSVEPKHREAYNTSSDLVVVIDTLDQLSQELATATNGPEAFSQFAKLEAGARTQSNSKAAAYKDFLESRLPDIAKKLSTQPGVLTERDIDRARASAWKFFDTKSVRDFKMNLMKELFNLQRQSAKDTALGAFTDTSSARQSVERILGSLEQIDERSRLEYLREKQRRGQ